MIAVFVVVAVIAALGRVRAPVPAAILISYEAVRAGSESIKAGASALTAG